MEYRTESPEEAKERRITQLRKGILELAVLGVLSEARHYGYSLVKALSERGAGGLKEGTIYPILARLDREGAVRSEWVASDQGPPRKYYSLSPAGYALFVELLEAFDQLVTLVHGDRKQPAAMQTPTISLVVNKR